jgi:hypothetical protein
MCEFPGCIYSHFLDAHHREFHRKGGDTVLENLHPLCRFHHRLIHEGEVSMERGGNGMIAFKDKRGKIIEAVPEKPQGSTKRLAEGNKARGLTLTSETPRSGWDGTPVSLFDCGDAIFRARDQHKGEARDPPP